MRVPYSLLWWDASAAHHKSSEGKGQVVFWGIFIVVRVSCHRLLWLWIACPDVLREKRKGEAMRVVRVAPEVVFRL